jgi:universal stress protein A
MKTVLAPIDFSPTSRSVIREATKLASHLNGRVVLLYVLQTPLYTPIPGYGPISGYSPVFPNLIQATSDAEEAVTRKLAALKQTAQKTFAATEAIQRTGGPVAHILDQAKKLRADYIVMGSHGHTAFYDLFVGSVTRTVLQNAACPVLVVSSVKHAKKTKNTKVASSTKSQKARTKSK